MRILRGFTATFATGAGLLAVGVAVAIACTTTYTLTVSPSTVTAGTPTALTFVLGDSSGNLGAIGSANLVAPWGLTVDSASLPSGAKGTVTISGSTVELRSISVPLGKTLDVTVTVTAPSDCSGSTDPTFSWGSSAWENSNASGSSLTVTGGAPTTTVTSPCKLVFTSEPADANVGQTISSSPENPTGAPVAVTIEDQAGNVVKSSTPVTLAVGTNPGSATLGGTTTEDASGGVASFANLTLNEQGYGYTLAASSAGLSGATSTTFNEYTTGSATVCQENVNCTGTATDDSTQGGQTGQSLSVTADYNQTQLDAGLLTTALDQGVSYFTAHSSQCDGYTPIGADTDVFNMTASTRAKVLTDTVTTQVLDLAEFDQLISGQGYCLAAPYPFTGVTGAATATTLPTGGPGYIAKLDTCTNEPSQPCVASSTGILQGLLGSFTITVDIPAGESGDPQGGH